MRRAISKKNTIHKEIRYELEYINIHITEGGRTKRSTEDTFHPETYDLDVPLLKSHLNLHLTRNDNIRTSVPTLSLKGNSMTYVYLEDKIFGTFIIGSEEYIVQTTKNKTYTTLKSGFNQFAIRKEKIPEINFNDFLEKVDTTKQATDRNHTFTKRNHRHKRATGLHQLELLIMVDYAVYKYWYDQSTQTSTSQKETEALTSINSTMPLSLLMDGMFKNIQTSSYTIDILYAGIVIAQTPSDAVWTETIKVTSYTPNRVDASTALSNFQIWNNNPPFSLPGHDHAMLFTRYDLRLNDSKRIAGLAYLSQVCTSISQSIEEDRFSVLIITVAAHELGHCLSAQHDGEGNGCSGNDAYIMASVISPQTKTATATRPWIFSKCSTSYFTNYITNSLDSVGNNCMKTLSAGFHPTGLTSYDQQLAVQAVQVLSADDQCVQIRGSGSYFCNHPYSGDFSTVCTRLWCYEPTAMDIKEVMMELSAWCISGVCTLDSNARVGDETCLYGNRKGAFFTNGWTCEDMVREAPQMCAAHTTACCASCASTTRTPATSTTTPAITTVQLKTSSVTSNNQTGNYSLILGLAVGIPFFVLLFVFTILLCICCKSHKLQKTKTKDTEEDQVRPVPIDENFFNSYVANCYGGKHFQTYGGYWDNKSFESPEDIERTSYLGNKSNCSGQSKHSFKGYLPKRQRNPYTTNRQNYNGRLSHI
ncbi:unnamed protein product [Mytilus coruscus]|uniref:Peptidase M12B domain-containing protein n=1 Tax=Mytilus coruscus TaxID=42192 RepID=A0A6J8CAK3_MYTCO|nr:unnamed protein product [Mytilus coruscus]